MNTGIETKIVSASGITVHYLSDKGWEHLANGLATPRGEWATYLYKGDRDKAMEMYEKKQAELKKQSKEYYSQKWV